MREGGKQEERERERCHILPASYDHNVIFPSVPRRLLLKGVLNYNYQNIEQDNSLLKATQCRTPALKSHFQKYASYSVTLHR